MYGIVHCSLSTKGNTLNIYSLGGSPVTVSFDTPWATPLAHDRHTFRALGYAESPDRKLSGSLVQSTKPIIVAIGSFPLCNKTVVLQRVKFYHMTSYFLNLDLRDAMLQVAMRAFT